MEWLAKRKAPLQRKHLMEKFDISKQQATLDIKKFLELYPGSWIYDVRKKHYERVIDA